MIFQKSKDLPLCDAYKQIVQYRTKNTLIVKRPAEQVSGSDKSGMPAPIINVKVPGMQRKASAMKVVKIVTDLKKGQSS